MSKKSQYAAWADACRLRAEESGGEASIELLEAEAQWRRLARGCYDSLFGPPVEAQHFEGLLLRFVR